MSPRSQSLRLSSSVRHASASVAALSHQLAPLVEELHGLGLVVGAGVRAGAGQRETAATASASRSSRASPGAARAHGFFFLS